MYPFRIRVAHKRDKLSGADGYGYSIEYWRRAFAVAETDLAELGRTGKQARLSLES